MAKKRMVLEIGMGTDIRGARPDQGRLQGAARRALAQLAVDRHRARPAAGCHDRRRAYRRAATRAVDKAQVLAVLPYGKGTVTVVEGGLEIRNDAGTDSTLIANACAIVSLDIA